MLFINFKTYPHATGAHAVRLADICETVHKKTGVPIFPVVQALDLRRVKQAISIPVWLQHVDPYEPGAHSGFVSLEAAQEAGAAGTLINHSEHPMDLHDIDRLIKRRNQIKSTLKIMLCAPDIDTLEHHGKYSPDYFAYEPPEYIGSTTESVATTNADTISHAREVIPDTIPLLAGAGVKSADDIRVSRERGAVGALIATAVVKAKDPEKTLTEIALGFD